LTFDALSVEMRTVCCGYHCSVGVPRSTHVVLQGRGYRFEDTVYLFEVFAL
jgi:hypothetical protein